MRIAIGVCELCASIHGSKIFVKIEGAGDGEARDVCHGCQEKPFRRPTDEERALAKFRLANVLEEAAKKLRQMA